MLIRMKIKDYIRPTTNSNSQAICLCHANIICYNLKFLLFLSVMIYKYWALNLQKCVKTQCKLCILTAGDLYRGRPTLWSHSDALCFIHLIKSRKRTSKPTFLLSSNLPNLQNCQNRTLHHRTASLMTHMCDHSVGSPLPKRTPAINCVSLIHYPISTILNSNFYLIRQLAFKQGTDR